MLGGRGLLRDSGFGSIGRNLSFSSMSDLLAPSGLRCLDRCLVRCPVSESTLDLIVGGSCIDERINLDANISVALVCKGGDLAPRKWTRRNVSPAV